MRCGTYTHDFLLRRFHCILYIHLTLYTLLQYFMMKTFANNGIKKHFASITLFNVMDLICKCKQLSLQDDYHVFIKSGFTSFWQLIHGMRPSSINSRERHLWRCLDVRTIKTKIRLKSIKDGELYFYNSTL